MTEETNSPEVTDQLQVVIDQNGLETETRIALKSAFDPFYHQAEEWKQRALGLTVTSSEQIEEMAQAREARLALKEIRVNVEKTRVSLKEDSLRKGKAIDSIAKVLKELITPTEEHLEKQEKFIEIQEAARKAEMKQKRHNELAALETNPDFYNLAEMSEEEYQQILDAATYMANKRKEDARKAEESRLQAIEDQKKIAAAAEMEKILLAAENARLKAQVKEVKSELKETKEVLKETKTELVQEKAAFNGFTTGTTQAATLNTKNVGSTTGKVKEPGENEAQDHQNLKATIEMIKELTTRIPAMTTPKGKSVAHSITILLGKTNDYIASHTKEAGKINA